MNTTNQIRKAQEFLMLHAEPKLLVLPNIWDPLGARMLEDMGFPAVATASAAVAYSLGFDDGEVVDFEDHARSGQTHCKFCGRACHCRH